MTNTTRQTVKINHKFYDNMSVNDWNLNFEYETENNVLSRRILVNGTKGSSSVFISKQDNQIQTIFSNGDYDSEVVTAVITECDSIEAAHSVAAAPIVE